MKICVNLWLQILLLSAGSIWAQNSLLDWENSANVKEEVTFDLDNEMALSQHKVFGVPLGDGQYLSLKDYLEQNGEDEQKKLWRKTILDELAKKETTGQGQGLIRDIELPKVSLPGISSIIGSGAELKVGGSQKITIGGTRDYVVGEKPTEFGRPSKWPDLKIKQEQIVNLEGVIGTKIHVFVDYNSQAESELKNKIRLKYVGEEDEIIKLIEAGDTDFSLPGTQFVSGVSAAKRKGLFGIKGMAKLGGLNLTTILVKEQGKSEKGGPWRGHGVLKGDTLFDYDYIKRKYFWLGNTDTIIELKVYILSNDQSGQSGIKGRPIDFSHRDFGKDSTVDTLERSFYFDQQKVNSDYNVEDYTFGIINLRQSLSDEYILAVAYRTKSGCVPDSSAFDTTATTVNLKLIRPRYCYPYPSDSSYCWDYELKNYYDLGSRGFDRASVELHIEWRYGAGTQWTEYDTNNLPFVSLLGIGVGDNNPNNFNRNYINPQDGVLFFPFRYFPYVMPKPFADSVNLSDPNPNIYNTKDIQNIQPDAYKYRLRFSYRDSVPVINLGINIIEGSEIVKLNGVPLSKGQYNIDYESGIVTFSESIADKVSDPANEIEIEYEYAPFMSLANRSIVGVRGDYQLSEDVQFGGTIITRSERLPGERPKLGEEPNRGLVTEFDAHLKFRPSLMTELVDLLPLVETDKESNLTIDGEIAASFPNPNTKGVVYIDDMEGTKTSAGILLGRTNWNRGSLPVGMDTSNFAERLYWEENNVQKGQIYTQLTGTEATKTQSVLSLYFSPKPGLSGSSWASLMQCPLKAGLDLTESKLLQLVVKGNHGKLHIDFGPQIQEGTVRRIANGTIVWHSTGDMPWTEDKDRNGQLALEEDTGLDGVMTGQQGDDGNDDYGTDLEHINGTEGNQRLDTEDLNFDSSLEIRNDYYEFSFDLSDTQETNTHKYNTNHWHSFSIPIAQPETVFGNPKDWRRIVYARIWLESETGIQIQIANFEITGNRWLVDGIIPPDSTASLTVSVKNNKDNADYTPPPPPYDPGKDETGKTKQEQSLVLNFNNLKTQSKASAHRSFWSRNGDDYTQYKKMNFYLHGEKTEGTFFVRLNFDSLNYYEYKTPIQSGWQSLEVNLDQFVQLKQKMMSSNDSVISEGGYGVNKRPSLTSIRRITIGIENTTALPISGEVWIDDIRLTSVRKDRGIATRINLGTQFADFLSLNVGFSRQESEYMQLEQKTPSANTIQSLSISGGMTLQKFLPEKWGFSLPLSASLTQTDDRPRFVPGTDIRVTPEESKKQKAVSFNRGLSLSYSKSPSSNKILNWTLDRITAGVSLTKNLSRSPLRADTVKTKGGNFTYSYGAGQQFITLFKKIRFYYLPSFSFGGSYQWSYHHTFDYEGNPNGRPNFQEGRSGGASTNITLRPFTPISYSLNRNYELQYRQKDHRVVRKLIETNRGQSFSFQQGFNVKNWLSPRFSYTARYGERRNMQYLHSPPDSIETKDVALNRTIQLETSIDFNKIFTSIISKKKEVDQSQREAKPDTLQEKKKKEILAGSPEWIFLQILAGLKKLPDKLQPISVSFTEDRSSQAGLLKRRPSWQYQFGFYEQPKEERLSLPGYQRIGQDSKSKGYNWALNSGFSFANLNLKFSFNRRDDWTTTGPATRFSHATTWPQISAALASVEKIGLFGKMARSSSISSDYSLRKETGGSNTTGKEETESKSFSKNFSNSWTVRWKNGMNTTITGKYGKTVGESGLGSQRPTRRKDRNQDYSLSFSYSFSAPGGFSIPIWKLKKKKIRFSNNLDLALDFSTGKNLSEQEDIKQDVRNPESYRKLADNVYFSAKPSARYNFSSSVNGGFSGEYTQRNNKLLITGKRRVITIDIWAQIIF
ncbi:MAG: hypothetical protein AB1393_01855 [Candidatus Edwardsbacteria bacterium]